MTFTVHNATHRLSVPSAIREMPMIVASTRALCEGRSTSTVFVVRPAADRAAVEAAMRELREDGRFREIYEARTGCTVVCHCGPNTIGVIFLNQ